MYLDNVIDFKIILNIVADAMFVSCAISDHMLKKKKIDLLKTMPTFEKKIYPRRVKMQ
jgi:hypothetical protein